MNAFVLRALVAVAGGTVVFAQTKPPEAFPALKETLTESQRAVYLAAARKAWIQLDDELSDAKPVATCFAKRLSDETALVPVDWMQSEVIFRFHDDGAVLTEITMLLHNGEKIWSFSVLTHRENPFITPCMLAGAMIENLRFAMQKARDNPPR